MSKIVRGTYVESDVDRYTKKNSLQRRLARARRRELKRKTLERSKRKIKDYVRVMIENS